MPRSSAVNDKLLNDLYNIYSYTEEKMLEKVAKRLQRGIKETGSAELKLRDVQELRNELNELAKKMNDKAKSISAKSIKKAYGIFDQGLFIDDIPEQLQRIIMEANNVIENVSFRALRSTEDIYREAVSESSMGVMAGANTRQDAIQNVLNKFAAKGVTGFVDKAGRHWDLASYSEMAIRTATSRAALQGHIDRQTAIGNDLIMVSSFGATCPICAPWAGKVLSISGKDPRYPSLESAKAAGLFHPNCKHTITAYFEGMDYEEPKFPYNPELYAATQRQRYNERQIRKWKRLEAVALTPEEKEKASRKVRAWQSIQRQHIKEWNLKRKYGRESIKNRVGDASKVRTKPEPKPAPKVVEKPKQERLLDTADEVKAFKGTPEEYIKRFAGDAVNAKEAVRDVADWVYGAAYPINQALREGTQMLARDKSVFDTMETLIQKMPKWGNKTLYRGVRVDKDTAQKWLSLKKGDKLDMPGITSWASKADDAKFYASITGHGAYSGDTPVIIKARKGAEEADAISLKKLFDGKRDEIVFSKDTVFEVEWVGKTQNGIEVWVKPKARNKKL